MIKQTNKDPSYEDLLKRNNRLEQEKAKLEKDKISLNKKIDEMEDRLSTHRVSLQNFLKENGVQYLPYKTMEYYLSQLSLVQTIKPSVRYLGIHTNTKNYIKDAIPIDGVIEKIELPVDINRGYYRYEKGKIILDERKRLELWR